MLFGSKKKPTTSKTQDWATDIANLIEGLIDQVRDKAIVPLMTAARVVVYGLLILIVGFAALLLVSIGLVRMLNVYLENVVDFASTMWLADLIVGTIFVLCGLVAWRYRYPRGAER